MTKITVCDQSNNVKATFTRVISALLTRTLSGECTFEFSVTAAMAADIQTGYPVTLESDNINYRFRTVKVSKSISSGMTICKIGCEHISNLLNDPEFDIEKFEFKGAPADCLAELLKGTPLIAGECETPLDVELLINQKCTRRAALMQLVGLSAGEIDYNGNAVCIRNHLGSEEYRDIMDGKNITDLTVDMDSRSNTYNYGIKLYKKLDFAVGDNVHIVFSPFSLDVQTRIISMSLNPFNRSEISIEVGDYVPSISDNLYKIEQTTNKISTDITEASASLKTGTNDTDILVENKEIEIFRIPYNAVKDTYAAFIATIIFIVKTAGTLTFILKKDENEKIRYTEQFSAQDYTRTISYPFVSESGVNVISISAVSPDGSMTLPAMKSWGYVIGAYIVGDNPWNGYIRMQEKMHEFIHKVKWEKRHEKISDKATEELTVLHRADFSETLSSFVKQSRRIKKHEQITFTLPPAIAPLISSSQPLKAENISDTEVYIEMRNPVTADGELVAGAFSMSVTVDHETIVDIVPVEAYIDELSDPERGEIGGRIRLVFGEATMRESVQEIALFYYGDKGNLFDAFSGQPCEDFRTAFNYTAKEQ